MDNQERTFTDDGFYIVRPEAYHFAKQQGLFWQENIVKQKPIPAALAREKGAYPHAIDCGMIKAGG